MKHGMIIIGFGNQGQWHYENIRDRIGDIEVIGAYDIRSERMELARKFGLRTFSTPQEVYACTDADIILVATPNHVHKQYSIEAMRAGKNVVCEKPVCMNCDELDEVLAVASATGMIFTVHQNRRWDADYCVVKNILREKLVGKPYFIDSRLFGCKGLPGDWRSARVAGGGMLYDWSVHLIDQMVDLIDSKPISVYVDAVNVHFPDVDDCNRISVRFENGVRYQIVVDSWCYIGEGRWHICGDDGTAVVPVWGGTDGKVMKANIKEIGWEEGFIFTSNGRSSTMAPRPVENLREFSAPIPELPRWESFYENFIKVVEGKESLLVSHEDNRLVMKILDACFRSVHSGNAERIETE
ncbi:MAG: Gfo/Idh/MocA family oxidoreductase [Clostridia bacterium]|nr:Gfo/Idh/MocA family oxidoreductase [Clostridia bacterium]